MSDTYYRCRHCRGFYETTLEKCKWCSYQTPVLDKDGQPRVYPDRETARAIQIAEYEQLPPEAHEDPMRPPPENLTVRCACIHCGPEGQEFEAVEMRWMANERMWACPCTTCGGRGFHFDIHPVEPMWECAECHHWYKPEKFTSKYAKCPRCGSRHANGWYDDENEDGEPMTDEEREAEEARLEAELAAEEAAAGPKPQVEDEEIPWEDDIKPYDPSQAFSEGEADGGEPKLRDDIDFPHTRDDSPPNHRRVDDGDIPF